MKNFSPDLNSPATEPSASIANASNGLIYISETDANVVPIVGIPCDQVDQVEVLRMSGKAPDAPVEEVAAQEFFDRLTEIRDWYGEREKERARRYEKLYEVLKTELKDLRVFRIGEIKIDIYAVGINREGKLEGVMTRAVET